jgi:hypothetical protein
MNLRAVESHLVQRQLTADLPPNPHLIRRRADF